MQVKEIWITQKRKVDIPWALHVTAYKKGEESEQIVKSTRNGLIRQAERF